MNQGILADRLDDLQYWNHFDNFARIPVLTTAESIASNLNYNVSGTNAVSTSCALNGTTAILMTTTGAANDQVIIGPATTAGQSGLNTAGRFVTDASPYFETCIRTGASIAATRIWAGLKLTSTSVIATDADGAFFIYDSAVDTNWRFVLAIGGVQTSYIIPTPAVIPVVGINTIFKLRIGVQPDRSVLADIQIGTGLGNLNSQGNHWSVMIPSGNQMTTAVNLKPYFGVQTLTTAAKTLGANYIRLARKYT